MDIEQRLNNALQLWRCEARREALAELQTLTRVAPDYPPVWNNLGYMLLAGGQVKKALLALQQAVALQPAYWQAWTNLGLAQARLGDSNAAWRSLEQAHELAGGDPLPLLERARMEAQSGAVQAAECSLQRAWASATDACNTVLVTWLDIALSTNDVRTVTPKLLDELHGNNLYIPTRVALRNLLNTHRVQVEQVPDLLLAWVRLEKSLGMFQAAQQCLDLLLGRFPDCGEGLREAGWLASETGRLELAMQYFSTLARLQPDDWRAWNDGGCTLRAMGHQEEAIDWMMKALECVPDNATLHANVALLHHDRHDYVRAQAALDRALALDNKHPEALHTQAMVLGGQGRHAEAYDLDLKALSAKPDYPQARLGLALSALTLGRWQEGFAGYEYRWNGSDQAGRQPMPTIGCIPWRGAPVYPGSRIVILPEQGFGDHFQFARFIPILLERFHQVDWVVPAELHALMAVSLAHPRLTIHGGITTLNPQRIDFECPFMSLPLALGISLETLPVRPPYLQADPVSVERWRQRLDLYSGKKIGLAWSGRSTLAKHGLRAVPVEKLGILAGAGRTFVSLHRQAPGQKTLPPLSPLLDWMDDCPDFMHTAALISALDLVIATDTAVAHLAGALGKPVWLLNRFGSEWRWLAGRIDSPWYPSMRIFNQLTFNNWSDTLCAVRESLDLEVRKG